MMEALQVAGGCGTNVSLVDNACVITYALLMYETHINFDLVIQNVFP